MIAPLIAVWSRLSSRVTVFNAITNTVDRIYANVPVHHSV